MYSPWSIHPFPLLNQASLDDLITSCYLVLEPIKKKIVITLMIWHETIWHIFSTERTYSTAYVVENPNLSISCKWINSNDKADFNNFTRIFEKNLATQTTFFFFKLCICDKIEKRLLSKSKYTSSLLLISLNCP